MPLLSNANERTLDNIFEEYEAVRMATIMLFKNLDNAPLQRSGIANENRMSVRAAAYHIAGHELLAERRASLRAVKIAVGRGDLG